MVAEKLEALVRSGAVANAGERRDVGECLFEQSGVSKTVADALLKFGKIVAAALLFGLRSRCQRLFVKIGTLIVADGRRGIISMGRYCSPAAHRTIVNSRFQ